MLKRYHWRGRVFQFEEGKEPKDAEPIEEKAAKKTDKSKKAANKAAKPADK